MAVNPVSNIRDNEWMERLSRTQQSPYLTLHAFYSSYIGGVTTNPSLMCVPIDDHLVHRGHGVFDAGSFRDGQAIDLESHVLRLLRSADALSIEHALRWSVESICSIVRDTIQISARQEGMYRVFLSTGPGSFGIHSSECTEPCLYVVVYTDRSALSSTDSVLREVTVSESVIPMKHPKFATVKSVDYLNNELLADYALAHGGRFGIWIGIDGAVKESSIFSLVVITPSGTFVSPAGEDILESSTVRRLAVLSMSHRLVSSVHRGRIDLEMLLGASEVLLCGADVHIHPVVMIDGKPIGNGSIGQVTKELQRLSQTV